jgi:hypothetical protein
MASLRAGTRKDGSTYVQVLYRLDGKQSSTSFEDLASAEKFKKLIDRFGPAKALRPSAPTPNSRRSLSESGLNTTSSI